MKYSDIRDELQTGDIVLWSGKGHISDGIKLITGGQWSHISRILRCPETDMVLNWESTTLSNLVDRDTGRNTKGVQVVELSQRLAQYDGKVAIRQISPLLAPYQLQRLYQLRRTFKGRSYEESLIELIKAAYDGPMGQNKPDLSSLFCSELVAEGDMLLGLFSKEVQPANEFTPMDYGEGQYVDALMAHLGSHRYGPELMIEQKIK